MKDEAPSIEKVLQGHFKSLDNTDRTKWISSWLAKVDKYKPRYIFHNIVEQNSKKQGGQSKA